MRPTDGRGNEISYKELVHRALTMKSDMERVDWIEAHAATIEKNGNEWFVRIGRFHPRISNKVSWRVVAGRGTTLREALDQAMKWMGQ